MNLVPVSGNEIAVKAVEALRSGAYPTAPGWCEQFVREVVQAACPKRSFYNAFWRASARLTMLAFRHSLYSVWDRVGMTGQYPDPSTLRPGDILYKGDATSGPDGHTGVLFHNTVNGKVVLCVAENSSYHTKRGNPGAVDGAKGFRTLEQFGTVEMVVRLSQTSQA